MKNFLLVLWFLIDPKGCLMDTTTKKEREAMGVQFDR